MVFNTGAALLDAIVLAVVSTEAEGTYGYKITHDVRQAIAVSESTLYPVLRRLQKEECLEAYDREFAGRNRRYYKITDKGRAQLRLYREEWISYSSKITRIFSEVKCWVWTGTNFYLNWNGFCQDFPNRNRRKRCSITEIILMTPGLSAKPRRFRSWALPEKLPLPWWDSLKKRTENLRKKALRIPGGRNRPKRWSWWRARKTGSGSGLRSVS